MLDPSLFRIPRFGLGSLGIASAFAVMFGMFFGFAQFMQFVLGYSALDTAIRTLPFAATMIAFSQLGPRLASRIGVRSVIAGGLLLTSIGLLWMSAVNVSSGYLQVVGGLSLAAAGMALYSRPPPRPSSARCPRTRRAWPQPSTTPRVRSEPPSA